MNNRRKLVIGLSVGPLAWVSAVFGQSKMQPVVIGWLSSGSRTTSARTLVAFKEGMAALGWKEGSNYILEGSWAEGRVDRLPDLAEALAAKKPIIIVAAPVSATIAAAKAAPKTPIVQATGNSPIDVGLAKSLGRPGGMVTGVTNLSTELSAKYLEVLLAAAPKLKRVGFLARLGSTRYTDDMANARNAAERYRVEARFAEVGQAVEIESAIARLAKEGAQGLVVLAGFNTERTRIVKLALAQHWPVIAAGGAWVRSGALLSYGPDIFVLHRRAAYYVDRILKGAKPGDLPIEQPMTFELVVNMKTAKLLGLTMPPEIMVRATQLIE